MATSTDSSTRAHPQRDSRDRRPRLAGVWAVLRNAWRGLTAMRTALVLLFLLALAALPGALLPQRSLNQRLVDQYFADYPWLAPTLDRLGFFDVFAAPWFAAIYLLLMVSLIGCVLPRTVEHFGALREVGNLLFHLSLIGLLLGFAAGKLFGYEGQVIVMSGGGQFCNTGILGYDTFRAGLRVDGTDLTPFCVRLDDFQADFQPNGQAESFRGTLSYQSAEDVEAGVDEWHTHQLEGNHPLRVDSNRVYLLGHGYAPRFTVTWPDGQQRTGEIQWRPVDQATLLSEGATKFEPPGVTDEERRRTSQLAITGLFAPTSSGGDIVTSVFPALLAPEVAVDVLRGDLGLDDGRGQSIFQVDQRMVDSGALTRVARANLVPGGSLTLDDGTVVRFDGVQNWAYLQISYDPGQEAVLLFAVLLLAGLGFSLTIRRRRFWARLTPTDDGARTVVEIGGLARTDRAGYGEEFDRLRTDLLDEPTTAREDS